MPFKNWSNKLFSYGVNREVNCDPYITTREYLHEQQISWSQMKRSNSTSRIHTVNRSKRRKSKLIKKKTKQERVYEQYSKTQ
jgi:hypothetical protein